jgi:hypothetical protein
MQCHHRTQPFGAWLLLFAWGLEIGFWCFWAAAVDCRTTDAAKNWQFAPEVTYVVETAAQSVHS